MTEQVEGQQEQMYVTIVEMTELIKALSDRVEYLENRLEQLTEWEP